jgi:tetratricopeptide (TPR) repeat protein
MAKRQPMVAETLEDLQDGADRLAAWIQGHLVWVVGGVLGLLILVGAFSLYRSYRSGQEEKTAIALATAQADYRQAMGASPDSLDVPELANPEAAERIRKEYVQRFDALADSARGSVAGTLARVEAAELRARGGDAEGALAAYRQALAQAPDRPALRGMVMQRIAQGLESQEHWKEASEEHEAASKLPEFPLRGWALADAARCATLAGDRSRALALYERLETQFPDIHLPDYQRMQVRELRAAAAAS